MPADLQLQIREMIKNAILEYLLKRYIANLVACQGGLPSIEEDAGRPKVKIIAIKGIKNG